MGSMNPILLLQLRPEDDMSDNEYQSLLNAGLPADRIWRVRMDKEAFPDVSAGDVSAVILGGGPCNVSDAHEKQPDFQRAFEPPLFNLLREVVATDTPFLGLCYGMSALTQTLGGVVSKKYSEKVSVIDISLTAQGITDELLADLPAVFASCSGHKEATEKMPQGAVLLASSEQCPVHMYKLGQNVYATQFHPELDLESFVLRLRAYKNSGYFSPDELETLIEEARRHDVSEVQKILVNFANRYVTSLR